MPWEVLNDALPYLAALVYLLVNRVLVVLTTHRRQAIAVHDRVVQARALRQEYLITLQEEMARKREQEREEAERKAATTSQAA